MTKTIFKKWSKQRTLNYMIKHWTKYRFQNASQVIADKSGFSLHTIRFWRTKLELPDNRLKHEENKITKSRTNRVSR